MLTSGDLYSARRCRRRRLQSLIRHRQVKRCSNENIQSFRVVECIPFFASAACWRHPQASNKAKPLECSCQHPTLRSAQINLIEINFRRGILCSLLFHFIHSSAVFFFFIASPRPAWQTKEHRVRVCMYVGMCE